MVFREGSSSQISPDIFVSVGTGKPKELSGINLRQLFRLGLRKITDTEQAHRDMLGRSSSGEFSYYRFDVLQEFENSDLKGISSVKLDQVKKTKCVKKRGSGGKLETEEEQLQTQAASTEGRRQDGYKPDKYDYLTFDKLRDRTLAYCRQSVNDEIRECAAALQRCQSQRKKNDLDRWNAFRRHPNPKYQPPQPTEDVV